MLPASSSHPRRIALVDCNNFYASCERLFNPAWERRPLGVLSNNDGCLIARSNELKAAGIPMGAPYFQIRAQLEALDAVVVSSNYALYGDLSARVMQTLGQFTPELEIYSIDEAWLDLTGFDPARLDGYGRRIVRLTRQHTGIPVSMGIAPTKVLAKIANRICKQRNIPGAVFNIGSGQALDDVLAAVPVGEVWGIGRRRAEQLGAQRIHTALDLRNADPRRMRARYNVVMQRLIYELRGRPCLGPEDIRPRQEIIASRAFGARVTARSALCEAVALHASRAGEKLRAQGSVCGALQVFIHSGRHHPDEAYFERAALARFPVPTADTRRLIQAACRGIEQIYREGVRYAKAGVILMDISPAGGLQSDLFDRGDSARSIRLMETMDRINRRYGRKTVFLAREGYRQTWAMKRERMTQAYTTRWEELPSVR